MNNLEKVPQAQPEDTFLELKFGEQMLLWGFRIWVCGYKKDLNTNNLIHLAYAQAGIPSAQIALDSIMTLITANGSGVMDVRCPSCTEISADEMRLMGTISALQSASSSNAGDIYLECWAKPATLRMLRPVTQMLANVLKEGGMFIRPRPWSLALHLPSRNLTSTIMHPITIH
ncbi:MAG: hypothetical protein CMF71_03620 [Magnetovibrio sp.]|nr:hypothetical protein [Magnetovibrio sp.]|tara:strand:+ start:368 stop:886 length:519 start_codon:yes stop_codon:yes gene_type:complete